MTARRSCVVALLTSLLAFAVLARPSVARSESSAPADLEKAFCKPADAEKPWAYWWWLNGNVTRQQITRDLEAMKRAGFGGLLHFDARGYHDDDSHLVAPESRMEFMDPQWREMLKFGIEEAQRLGLEVSVNLSSCAGALKGPWNVGPDAPKRLIWTSAQVRGPQRLTCELRAPAEHHFWNLFVLAVRDPDASTPPSTVLDLSSGWKEAQGKVGSGAAATEVLDLTDRIDAQGRLQWEVPAGCWKVLRFGYATMSDHEYDVDILDTKAVTGHFDRMGRAILADAGPARKALTHFYSVSWEGTLPTWTPGLDAEFQRLRGYSMITYLPVLTGMVVNSPEHSERFVRDYYATLSNLFRDHFYGTLQDLCHQNGLKWHSESGGPWHRNKVPHFANSDQFEFLARNDMPQGEYWYGRKPSPEFNRPIAIAAHIYGRRLAAAEAFTHMTKHWSAYPAVLKPCGDSAFFDGVNQLIWHTFTMSLPELGLPGSEYFAGTHINPNVTWFEQARPFLDYLARCQVMLRQGRFVGDVCTYVGDNAYLHWGRTPKWSEKPTLSLSKGYSYDIVNTEVLLDRLSVRDGRLVLPGGMSYRLLAVDLADSTVTPKALRKIRELAQAGAIVVLGKLQPARAPGLANYPAADNEVKQLAAELWGTATGSARRNLGRGQILTGYATLDDLLKELRVSPDFEGPFDYNHRQAGDLELYFVAGQGQGDCTFRVSGKEPELWDPMTGTTRDAVCYRTTTDGRTVVPLSLPENGSTFVVFRKPAQAAHIASVKAAPGALDIQGRSGDKTRVTVWTKDRCSWELTSGKSRGVECADLPQPLTLTGPWNVRFAPGWGAPESIVFSQLTPWNEHANAGIKYFSGKATYYKQFTLDAKQANERVRLDLGEVLDVAQVRVNGKDLGVVWTAPWTVDITKAVKAGDNVLEIDVINCWANRLIGDAGLPPEQRKTKSNVALVAGPRPKTMRVFQGYASEDQLMRSGLMGPVQLVFGRDVAE
jgi:hypothetical protein